MIFLIMYELEVGQFEVQIFFELRNLQVVFMITTLMMNLVFYT